MKIGFVIDDSLDRPDGVQQAVLTLGRWLSEKGHDVHYLVSCTERQDISNVHSLAKSFRVRFNGNTMTTPLPTSKKKIKQFYYKHHFDILHVQMPYSPFFAGQLIKLAPKKTKIVGTFHILPYGFFSRYSTKLLGLFIRSTLKKFLTFIAVSEPARQFAEWAFKIDALVIANPVETKSLLVENARINAVRRIVFLGRLEERKGVIELIEAYQLACKKRPELCQKTELVIGGKGPLMQKARNLITEIPNLNCTLLGFVPDKEKATFLNSANVAVFPSTGGESFGIVLVEAMAAGAKVVLGGDNPGYRSVLGEKPELLFEPKDIDKFSNKIIWALSDGIDSVSMTEWVKVQVIKYDVDTVGRLILKVYTS